MAFEALKRWLQVQGIMLPQALIVAVGAGLHVRVRQQYGRTLYLTRNTQALVSYLLIFQAQLGFIGAPVSLSITYWLMLGSMLYDMQAFQAHRLC
jgi:hypothetical protein